jgi:hypothetical protein
VVLLLLRCLICAVSRLSRVLLVGGSGWCMLHMLYIERALGALARDRDQPQKKLDGAISH